MTPFPTIVLLCSLVLQAVGCRSLRKPEQPPPDAPHFSVMTYNVLMTNPSDATVQAILDADADVVCLQETNDPWDALLTRKLRPRYIHRATAPHADPWNGVSVFSKFPIRKIEWIKPQAKGWFDSVLCVIETPLGDVQILNVHLRPLIDDRGSKFFGFFTVPSIHVREMQALTEHLAPDLPTLIVGDFNEPNDGKATRWLASNRAFTDALPEFDRKSPTFHGKLGFLPITYRLDHIMYSPHLHCFNARVIKAGESDHYPALAEFGSAK